MDAMGLRWVLPLMERQTGQEISPPRPKQVGQTHSVVYSGDMPRTLTADQESAMRTFPTLSQMVRDGRADTIQHGRRTRESLDYWFRQSERLTVARTRYGLRGTRFTDFARRIGVDRASAFQLVKLHKHHAAILADCREEQDKATAQGEIYFFPRLACRLGKV